MRTVNIGRGFDLLQVHKILLEDRRRTLAYKRSIARKVKKTDVVLDLGCGTGILSFFAAQKNPKRIYAVDKSQRILECAKKAARLNNLDGCIEFIQADIRKFKPREKISVLLHEQVGVFLWDEDMVDKVRYIRENYLQPRVTIIPSKIDLYLVPIRWKSALGKSLSYFKRRLYGLDFSCFARDYLLEGIRQTSFPSIIRLKNSKPFLCREKLAYSVDFRYVEQIPRKIKVFFKVSKDCQIMGICGFLKIHLDEQNHFSTKPPYANNNWGQIFMPCFPYLRAKKDSILKFTLFPDKLARKWRFFFEVKETKE